MANRRQLNGLSHFKNDKEFYVIVDIVARNYGKLPHEILNLSFEELFLAVYCILERSKRVQSFIKKSTRKKDSSVFSMINLTELVDLI